MKIISATVILSLLCFAATAQQLKPLPALDGKPARTMTTEEANRLNGNVDPVINGILYSQYILQQRAAKPAAVGPKGIKMIAAVQAADPAIGRKNEPAPAPALQKVQTEETAPPAKPAAALGVAPGE